MDADTRAPLDDVLFRSRWRHALVLGPAGGAVAGLVAALAAARGAPVSVLDPAGSGTIAPSKPPSRWRRLLGDAGAPDLVVVADPAAATAGEAATRALAAMRRGGLLVVREAQPRDVMRLLRRAPAERWFAPAPDDTPGGLRVLTIDPPRRRRQDKLVRRIDACLLYNELDLLTLRLEELWDHVDHFVVVEADQTFAGSPKPLFLREHAARFAPYADKLSCRVVEGLPPIAAQSEAGRFAREAAQRDAIGAAVAALDPSPDDIVVVSDVDELPRPAVVEQLDALLRQRDHVVLVLRNHRGYVNNVSTAALNGLAFAGSVACRVSTLRREGAQAVRRGREKSGGVIANRSPDFVYVDDAGWHFSSVGGPEAVWLKAANFSHIEDPYRVIGLGDTVPAHRVFDAALDREACRALQRLYLDHCERPAFAPLDFDRFEITTDVPRHMRAAKERYRGFFFFTDLA